MEKEYIEIKLDEADSFAERTKESLSHEEVFDRLRVSCSRDCKGSEFTSCSGTKWKNGAAVDGGTLQSPTHCKWELPRK